MSKKSSTTTSNVQNTYTTNQNLGDFTSQMDFSNLLGGSTIVTGGTLNGGGSKFSYSNNTSFDTKQTPEFTATTTNTTQQRDEATASVGVGVAGGSGSGGTVSKTNADDLANGLPNLGSSNNLIYIGIIGVIGFLAYFILRK